ncbi:MAG: hypothetical protein QNJ51_13835 [Calothrix sp. MO_167.B12]|nr:hypothetical protein [Calothrix sp. MO_167.B12]
MAPLQNILSKSILLAASIILLTSCIDSSEKCSPEVYIGLQLNSQQDVKLAKTFLYEASKNADNNLFHVDVFRGDNIAYMFSDPYNKKAIRDIIQKELEEKESNDKALINAFIRVTNLVIDSKNDKDLYAYIVSSGTSDKNTIQQIKKIVDDFAKNQNKLQKLHLYLIGLTTDNRKPIVDTALKSLPNTKALSIRKSEWKSHIEYNDCSSKY